LERLIADVHSWARMRASGSIWAAFFTIHWARFSSGILAQSRSKISNSASA